MEKILLVEDEKEISDLIALLFTKTKIFLVIHLLQMGNEAQVQIEQNSLFFGDS